MGRIPTLSELLWLPYKPADSGALAGDELRVWWCPHGDASAPRRQRVDALLRSVLAPTLGLPPAALRFARESKGRPFLEHAAAVDFNLSDTVGGSLIALSANGRIGVDLERRDRAPPVVRLAQRWFSADEAAALAALPAEQARIAFLHLWTAKEASCKATGTGIYGFLCQWLFAVSPEQPALLSLPEAAGAASRWRFLRLRPTPEHTAVLALRDVPAGPLRCLTLVPD